MAEITSHYRREGEFSLIEIRLGAVQQLFNSFDPSPFHEKDLDADAEDYIVGAVRELPLKTPLKLVFYLPRDELAAPAIGTLAAVDPPLLRLSARRRRPATFASCGRTGATRWSSAWPSCRRAC